MKSYLFLIAALTSIAASAQQNVPLLKIADTTRFSPVILPGNGLGRYDFFYAGENTQLSMYIVRKGKVTWSYLHPGKGEISDAELLPDGSVLFAHQFGVTKISSDKKIIWNYDAPPGSEIHTAQSIGEKYVVFVQNGQHAKLKVANIQTGKIEKEFELPVGNPGGVHGQFRRARLTSAGTILVAHMDAGRVVEYNADGAEIWSTPSQTPWSAIPLKNGNVLISGGKKTVAEINRHGDTLWHFSPADLPGYVFSNIQTAFRLNNGHTIINNWAGKGNGTIVQAIEVDQNKKIIWALRSWESPADLGRSTTIQLLDIPFENKFFGHFK
jgi:hypothetical protein